MNTTRGGSERILVCDDDDGVRAVLRCVLEREGFQVEEATNGLLGYAKALEFRPDLILIDWMMPVLDGRAATVRLKNDPFTAQIPIVMITSHVQPDDAAMAAEAGVDELVSKPFLPRALIETVRRRLRRSAGKKAARAIS